MPWYRLDKSPVATVSLPLKVAATVGEVEHHVVFTGEVMRHSAVAVPELSAVVGVGPPAVPHGGAVEGVAALGGLEGRS